MSVPTSGLPVNVVDPGQTSLAGAPHATVIRVPLAAVNDQPSPLRPRSCTRCGSMGFNVHQHAWRTVLDPTVKRVLIARYVCKRCGATCRVYPDGLGPERQSEAIKQICALLYSIGLTYRNVQHVLTGLGCPLSMTTIRHNVLSAHVDDRTPPPFDRLRMAPHGPAALRGADGAIVARVIGSSPTRRWLELETTDHPDGAELEWRVQTCARHFGRTSDSEEHTTGN